ncbi:hypothetical protein DFH09DRAFT_1083849 [Mycena vulgaris]|nr:hypothetical protein DFH09DRAFT_1083849 [Mycena vulgaris]
MSWTQGSNTAKGASFVIPASGPVSGLDSASAANVSCGHRPKTAESASNSTSSLEYSGKSPRNAKYEVSEKTSSPYAASQPIQPTNAGRALTGSATRVGGAGPMYRVKIVRVLSNGVIFRLYTLEGSDQAIVLAWTTKHSIESSPRMGNFGMWNVTSAFSGALSRSKFNFKFLQDAKVPHVGLKSAILRSPHGDKRRRDQNLALKADDPIQY